MRDTDPGVDTLLSFVYPLVALVGAVILLGALVWAVRQLL